MAEIAPFTGIRYDPTRLDGDLSAVIAPPYDVLGRQERDALLARHARNIVAIDLPHMPPGFAGPPEAYEHAARLLRDWLDDGTLIRERRASLYVYHQRFTHAGRKIMRRMFFARVRLEEFGRGAIFPHERTFGGPKEDRLMLTRATRCNLSPIFALYPDPGNDVATALNADEHDPSCRGRLDDVDNLLWVVDDSAIIQSAVQAMADRAIFIADGHHRYETALMYRDELAAGSGGLPDAHPANFVLMVLCAMEDDGLLILPTHRLVVGLDADTAAASLQSATGVRITSATADADDPVAPGTFRLFDGASGRAWQIEVNGPGILADVAPEHGEAWRRLDVAVLHHYLIDDVLSAAVKTVQPLDVRYVKDAADGRRKAREESALLIEMAPTSLSDLRRVCQAGELMPHKSTYFFPKLATGLLINPLAD